MFAPGDEVIKVLVGAGVRTCSGPYVVESVEGSRVRLVDSHLEYDAHSGRERDSIIPGMHSEIISYEGQPE